MDYSSYTSVVLFDALQRDLGIDRDPSGSRFDPFPYGFPTDLSVDEFSRYALLASAFKKTEVEEAPDAMALTFDAFLAANDKCSHASVDSLKNWDGPPSIGYSISTAKDLLEEWFHCEGEAEISLASIEMQARFGPGRSVALGRKPSLLYFKVGDSVHSATRQFIIDWYERSVAFNPVCEAAEMARQARHGKAIVVEHGNLTFVPKSYGKKRIVVTESSLNTYFQLGLGSELERVLQKHTGMSFDSQPDINADLARLGSIYGSYATMDLKQCSDFISLALVEYLFPPSVVRWVKILRTPVVKLPDESLLKLGMVSTMGNGFTFPLQTVLLSALVLGVYNTLGLPTNSDVGERTWGVFGDDIIVDTRAFGLLSRVIETLGLVVNLDKSFDTGDFRESCGSDWYQGQDVRGVYLGRYITDQDLFSAFNRLALWSSKHGIPLNETLHSIHAIINKVVYVPPDEMETSGIILPSPPDSPNEKGLWSYNAYIPQLSNFSFEFWEELTFGLELPFSRKKSSRFKRWLVDLKRVCGGSVNEPAVLKALLAGGLRRKRMIFRKKGRITAYRLTERVTPRWGFSPREQFPLVGTDLFNRLDDLVKSVVTLA